MDNKKKRGRPNRQELEKRDKRVTVRLNTGESFCLDEIANLYGVNSVEMIRKLIRDEYLKNFC
jgi:predicted DNA binding CopG/RHH family protein